MKTVEEKAKAIQKAALVFAIGLSSCATTTIDEFRQGQTGIEADETIVILGRREGSSFETDSDFVECVGERMGQGDNSISVVPEREFIDAMFPWFEPRNAPLRASDLERFMIEDIVARKMDEFRIRYMVWLEGETETDRSGSLSCAVGPGGGGCFGLAIQEDDTNFDATIWDLESLRNVGQINAAATGTSYMPAFVIPVPLPARVEANACNRLAVQLKDFVNGS